MHLEHLLKVIVHRVGEDDIGGQWTGRCLRAEKENRDCDAGEGGAGQQGHVGVPGQPTWIDCWAWMETVGKTGLEFQEPVGFPARCLRSNYRSKAATHSLTLIYVTRTL